MNRRIVVKLLAGALCLGLLSGCGSSGGQSADSGTGQAVTEAGAEGTADAADVASEESGDEMTDKQKADQVAALIDAIYVQRRTDETDEQCARAKEAWDELTDAQKELVEGENASPDYFGLDTGDASLDDPGNADDIGENELLVVSFGTSYNDSRVEDICGIEKALSEKYPDWSVRRAFSSQIIINHIQARDGEKIDNMDQALERAVANNVKNLVVLPTHLMRGAEYDELVNSLDAFRDKFEGLSVAEPLLGELKEDSGYVNRDKEAVALAVTESACKDAGYDSLEAAGEDGTAFVLLGHGTSHTAMIYYSQMAAQLKAMGYDNVFVGTVEGEPEETACENVITRVADAGYKKIVMRPLMVVAGDHANNDMAGDDEDSWKSMFLAAGSFETVDNQIAGLGRIQGIKDIYLEHAEVAIKELSADAVSSATSNATKAQAGETASLADGEYTADFKTDSGMFHVSEANDGKGTLTVKDGEMTIHVSLSSKKIVNLFPGMADDAKKAGASVLEPSVDVVTYPDGTTEEVHGFDVPVPYLDGEFDLALLGTKGTWYDHKVRVSVSK